MHHKFLLSMVFIVPFTLTAVTPMHMSFEDGLQIVSTDALAKDKKNKDKKAKKSKSCSKDDKNCNDQNENRKDGEKGKKPK